MPYCPNCAALLTVVEQDSACSHCGAHFGEGAIWKPTATPRKEPGATSERPSSGMQMAQAVGAVLAMLVASVTWWIAIRLSSGIGPFPASGGSSILVFLAPIAGLVGPLVASSVGRGAFAPACWYIAGAPILGAAAWVLFAVIQNSVWLSVGGEDAAPAAWAVLWLTPFVAYVCRTPARSFLGWTFAGVIASGASVALTTALEASLPSWMIVYRWWITYVLLVFFVFVGACRGEAESAAATAPSSADAEA